MLQSVPARIVITVLSSHVAKIISRKKPVCKKPRFQSGGGLCCPRVTALHSFHSVTSLLHTLPQTLSMPNTIGGMFFYHNFWLGVSLCTNARLIKQLLSKTFKIVLMPNTAEILADWQQEHLVKKVLSCSWFLSRNLGLRTGLDQIKLIEMVSFGCLCVFKRPKCSSRCVVALFVG